MKIGFDKVYCLSYCRNIERQKNVRKLMEYLGIDFTFIYGADYSNLDILKYHNFAGNPEQYGNWRYYTHYLGVTYDHYTAVMHAYASGANSVLIMEDDCAFINDVDYIKQVLNNYPKDADIVRFGYFSLYNAIKDNINIDLFKRNQFVCERNLNNYFAGTQLYGLCNRNIMKKYIENQKNTKTFIVCEQIWDKICDSWYTLVSPIALDTYAINELNDEPYKNDYKLLGITNL